MLPFFFFQRIPPLKKKLSSMYLDRANQIAPKIAPYLTGNNLDVGCGTGAISKVLRDRFKKKTVLVDVDYNQMCDLYPVTIYDGKRLPFKDKQFSSSLLLTVLHHAQNHDALLEEVVRVTKNQVIVMEDVFNDLPSRIITFVGDCLVNFEVHSPFRNHSKEDWLDIFRKKGLRVIKIKEFELKCVGFPFKLAIFFLKVPPKKPQN